MAIGDVGEFSSLALGNNVNDPSDRARLFYAGAKQLSTDGALKLDRDDTNDGVLSLGLTFGGAASGEGITSQRIGSGNLNGLDFYTGAAIRLSITNSGNVGIGTSNPAYPLDVNGILNVTAIYKNGVPWELATGEVTTPKIADNAVTNAKIQAGSVETTKLANLAVTSEKLADNAVTAAKILDGTVGTAELANAAVTALKIAPGAVGSNQLADGGVTALKIAPGAVGTSQLADGSISTLKIAPSAVGTTQLADVVITALKIVPGAVGTTQLADASVTALKIAPNAVGTSQLADAAVTALKIAPGAVGTSQLADAAVTALKIAPDAVGTSQLADGSVTLAKLEASAKPVASQWTSGDSGSISYNGGNVGIGTPNPHTQLTLTGSIGFTNATTPIMYIFQSGTSNPERPIIAHSPSYPNWGLSYRDSDDKMIFQSNGTAVMAVNLGGQRVGIGTTEPRTPLHVLGRISTGADFTSAGAITFFPPDGFAWFHIDNGPAGGRPIGRLRISHGGNPGDNEIISILQNSTVGIGTTSPGFKLDVAGSIRFGGFTANNADEWPNVVWYRDLGANWDEGLIKHASNKGFFGRSGFGIHIHSSRDWGIWSSGWTPLLGVEGGTGNVLSRGTIRQASSRKLKENINELEAEEAIATLEELNPVKFNYKADERKETHLGFVVEDVPELVASYDRQGLSSMDIVAVLTKVVQQQHKTISTLLEKVKTLEQQLQ